MLGVASEITAKINLELERWREIQQNDIPKYNALIRDQNVDVIGIKPE